MRRPSKAFTAILYGVALAVALISGSRLHAAEPSEAFKAERAQFVTLQIRTGRCMHLTADALIAQGKTSRLDIAEALVDVCGGPLRRFLVAHGTLSRAEAADYIDALAEDMARARLSR